MHNGNGKDSSWPYAVLLLATLVVAVVVRWPAEPARPLWHDEAWRAYAVTETSSLPELLAHQRDHPAPLNLSEWLLPKVTLGIFSDVTFAFRVWPIIFTLVAILGAYCLLNAVSTSAAGVVGAFLIAIGSSFVFETRHFKPYALDLAMTVWCFYWAVRVKTEESRLAQRTFIGILVLSALTSVVFVVIFPTVIAYRYRGVKWHRKRDYLTILLPIFVFSILYVFYIHPQGALDGTTSFWHDYYPTSVERIVFLASKFPGVLESYVPFDWWWTLALYFVVSPLVSLRARDDFWILLLLPSLGAVGLAVLELYPIVARPTFYLYGVVVIAVAYSLGGISKTIARAGPESIRSFVAVVPIVVAGLLINTESWGVLTKVREHPVDYGRESLNALSERFRHGDILLINYGAFYMIRMQDPEAFHGNNALLSAVSNLSGGGLSDRTPENLCESFLRSAGELPVGQRVWILSSHVPNAHRNYSKALSPMGRVKVIVADDRQSLVRLRLKKVITLRDCSEEPSHRRPRN